MRVAMTYLRLAEAEGAGDPGTVARKVFGADGWRERHPSLDVGVTWQGLHYLITGDPWDGPQPAADAVCGGRLLTEDGADELGVDVIYVNPDRVKLAADHLGGTPFEKVAARYDPARMAEAGVQDAAQWTGKPAEKVLRPAYDGLIRFFGTAAAEGQAVYKAMG